MTHTKIDPCTPVMLDCGHQSTPQRWADGSGTPGYAREVGTDRRICYACADAREQADLLTHDRYTAYLTPTKPPEPPDWQLTTWTGGVLAWLTAPPTKGRHNIGGYLWRFRAVDVHGQYWYGTSPGPNMYARMRKVKGKPRGK